VRCESFLRAAEDADAEAIGAPEQLVQRRLPADRDADQRRVERERDERGDGQPEPLAFDVDRDDRHARRHPSHQAAQLRTHVRLAAHAAILRSGRS
jgi:hypothetical protein